MTAARRIFIGTDGGATTSKIGAVWEDGTAVSTKLLQRPTGSEHGPAETVARWVHAIDDYLAAHGASWPQVGGVGLAIPGPYERYGVFGHSPNLPSSFEGFDVHTAYQQALAERAGSAIPLIVGNDGNMGGVAEAQHVRHFFRCRTYCVFVDVAGRPVHRRPRVADGRRLRDVRAEFLSATPDDPSQLELFDEEPDRQAAPRD